MSSLEWDTSYFTRHGHAVPELYYELWVVGQDRTAWYNMPVAFIYRKGKRLYQLDMSDDNTDSRLFTTLKTAKAMGIALYRMNNHG